MTVVLETLAVAAGCAVFYKLLKEMRNNLAPSAESIKEIKKAGKQIQGFSYKKFDQKCICEAFKEIPEDDFKEFVDKLQVRFQFKDATKGSILDILGTMDAQKKDESEFHFSNGKGTTFFQQIIAVKSNGMINLGIARYTFSFTLHEMVKVWYLFGFIPIKTKESSKKKTLTMTEGEIENLGKWCQAKLFKFVDQKCKPIGEAEA